MSGGHLRALCAIGAFIRCSVVSQYRSYKSLSVAMATYGIHARRPGIRSFSPFYSFYPASFYPFFTLFCLLQRVQINVTIKYYFKPRNSPNPRANSSQSRVQLKRDLSDYFVIPYLNIYATLDNEITSLFRLLLFFVVHYVQFHLENAFLINFVI